MVFFIIYIFCVICLVSIFLVYRSQDILGIIPDRIWVFLIFLCFIPILNTVMLLMMISNHDSLQVEDVNETLKEMEELDKKLKELSDKFNKR